MASQGERLLRLAGYSGQGGLGRNETGITHALDPSSNLGRVGLGYQPAQAIEAFANTESAGSLAPVEWFSIGDTIDDTPGFSRDLIDPALQTRLDASKSRLDSADRRAFARARQLSNPYEAIQGEGFQNRAAIKIAELDAMCNGLLSKPLLAMAESETACAGHVLDLCGGPGGFSEYFATRLGWRAHIWGVTLRQSTNDWAIHKFNPQASRHVFRALYGADGTGNLVYARNLFHVQQTLLVEAPTGVQVVVCDGGFDVQGRENHQERLSQQLIHAQLVLGMSVLASGGTLVCKLFDTVLPYTVALIELAARMFDAVAIVKPHQSRPANSEKFLVCRGFATSSPETIKPLVKHLFELVSSIDTWPNQEELAQRLLAPIVGPTSKPHAAVRAYVAQQNARFAQAQLRALDRLHVHMDAIVTRRGGAVSKPDHDQQAVRTQCLALWSLPVIDARWEGAVTTAQGVASRSLLNYVGREMITTLKATTPLTGAEVPETQTFALASSNGRPATLRVVWFGPYGPLGHWDWVSRQHVAWKNWPGCVQEHTILVAVCVSELDVHQDDSSSVVVVYAADAWCLPGMPFLYREPLATRRRLLDVFVQTCKDARLRLLPNISASDLSHDCKLTISTGRKPSTLTFSSQSVSN